MPASVVYYAVPTMLDGKKQLATAFQQAWNRHARHTPGPSRGSQPRRVR
jgi:hypothetical protein